MAFVEQSTGVQAREFADLIWATLITANCWPTRVLEHAEVSGSCATVGEQLHTERGVSVSRVPGEQNPAATVGIGESPVHRKLRKPHGIADAHSALGSLRQDVPETVENLLLALLFVVSRVVGDYPPQVVAPVRIGHRHHADQSRQVNPTGRAAPAHVPVEVRIRQWARGRRTRSAGRR